MAKMEADKVQNLTQIETIYDQVHFLKYEQIFIHQQLPPVPLDPALDQRWTFILTCYEKVFERSGNRRILFFKFALNREDRQATLSNIVDLMNLVTHNKLVLEISNNKLYLEYPLFKNPKPVKTLREILAADDVIQPLIPAENFQDLCDTYEIRRPMISRHVANRR